MVYKVALGLNLGKQGYLALMEIAFPEMFEALGCGLTYTHLEDMLNDNGKPPSIINSRNCRRPIDLGRR